MPTTKDLTRCEWTLKGNEQMLQYHDREWGVPVHDDAVHFEFLILESAQAGLSWSTVLNKRAGYRKAFANFDPEKVARFTERRVEQLCGNAAIIRNRQKICAAINNAQLFLDIQSKMGSFDAFAWSFVDGHPIQNTWRTREEVPVTTSASDAMSGDLKRKGFQFFGSTICYAHMQAVGMVNDHTTDCFRHAQVKRLAGGKRRR